MPSKRVRGGKEGCRERCRLQELFQDKGGQPGSPPGLRRGRAEQPFLDTSVRWSSYEMWGQYPTFSAHSPRLWRLDTNHGLTMNFLTEVHFLSFSDNSPNYEQFSHLQGADSILSAHGGSSE